MKKLEDYLNSKSNKIEASCLINVNDDDYSNIISHIVHRYNLVHIEQKNEEHDYKYKGENYKKVTGFMERVKILVGELSKERNFVFFRFRIKFIIDKNNKHLLIKIFEYTPISIEYMENKMIDIMQGFIQEIYDDTNN